ncbi:hypothetical protein CANCADRAFT_839 [Tortispora caseinolytica NRRL Y-17796]|uniref:SP-RING-type domain-containing protein n=1 Tax=Tortispora caseinolytica NRRL Y-17796 TaxID=767744 RepID=A0A1E4TKI2_9ASCO|nr:hypothetical protein CANCADRAFT_839 [Tortispora caseinolytica NRRL Y-17796]
MPHASITIPIETKTYELCMDELNKSLTAFDDLREIPELDSKVRDAAKAIDASARKMVIAKLLNDRAKSDLLTDDAHTVLQRKNDIAVEIAALPKSKRFGNDPLYKEIKRTVYAIRHADEDLPEDPRRWFDSDSSGGEDDDDENDDDLVVQRAVESFKCPLTGDLLQNPVTNSLCKHAYSKEAIMQYIERDPTMRYSCPVAGCTQFVSENVLIANPALERRLARHLRSLQPIAEFESI